MKTFVYLYFTLLSLLIFSTTASAETELIDGLTIDGILSTSIVQADNRINTPYNNGSATEKWDFGNRGNLLGLQIKARINHSLKFTSQLVARGGKAQEQMELDWAYLDFKTTRNTNIHVGKYKIPLFLVSDYIDVRFAYPWVQPPQEVYSMNPLISLSGLNWFYNIPLQGHNVLLQLYYGNGTHDVYVPSRSIDLNGITILKKDGTIEITTSESGGINLSFQSKQFQFRLGYFETTVDANAPLINGTKGSFTGIGISLNSDPIVIYAEYISRDIESLDIRAFPDQKAWYLTLGYKFGRLLPYTSYASIGQGEDETPLAIEQESTALGLRYDHGKTSAIKFEVLEAVPAQGNHGLYHRPVKSGHIYSASVDVIF